MERNRIRCRCRQCLRHDIKASSLEALKRKPSDWFTLSELNDRYALGMLASGFFGLMQELQREGKVLIRERTCEYARNVYRKYGITLYELKAA